MAGSGRESQRATVMSSRSRASRERVSMAMCLRKAASRFAVRLLCHDRGRRSPPRAAHGPSAVSRMVRGHPRRPLRAGRDSPGTMPGALKNGLSHMRPSTMADLVGRTGRLRARRRPRCAGRRRTARWRARRHKSWESKDSKAASCSWSRAERGAGVRVADHAQAGVAVGAGRGDRLANRGGLLDGIEAVVGARGVGEDQGRALANRLHVATPRPRGGAAMARETRRRFPGRRTVRRAPGRRG